MIGEDDFESIVRNFFSSQGGNRAPLRSNHSGEQVISLQVSGEQVGSLNGTFFIFDFSGKEILNVSLADKVILEMKDKSSIIGRYILPEDFDRTDFKWVFNNGFLEVIFRK